MTSRSIKSSWGRQFIDKDAVFLNFLFRFYRGWGSIVTYALYVSYGLTFLLMIWLVFGKTLTNSYVSDGTIFSCQVASENSMDKLFKRMGIRRNIVRSDSTTPKASTALQSGSANDK